MRYLYLILILALVSPCWAEAATVWVSKTGSATAPYDTEAKGLTTITAAESYCDTSCSPGDVVMIGDGTYTERFDVSHSGSSAGYITYQAKNQGSVTIDGGLTSWDSGTIKISGDYIKLHGLRITRGTYNSTLYIAATADHAYVKHCFVSHEILGNASFAFTEVIHNSGDYGLIEDSWAVGGARYIINDGGAGAGNGGSSYNVYRRVVIRWDWTYGNQPVGGFFNYHEIALGGGTDSIFQNCIALDFNPPTGHTGSVIGGFGAKYGRNMVVTGSMAVNMTGCGVECWSGISDQGDADDSNTGTNTITNNIIVNATNGYRLARGGRSNVSNLSVFLSDNTTGYMFADNTITNSLWQDNGTTSAQGVTYTYGHFDGNDAAGENSTIGDSGTLYPVRITDYSALDGTGYGGANRGAEIMYRIGADGAHYGDDNWDTLTSTHLWPWPNEAAIKADFLAVASIPSGTIPASNTPARGFTAGNSLSGASQTLTTYIWEQLGNTAPTDYYDGSAPPDPTCGAPNGIQDGDETGIDCGGSCPACSTPGPSYGGWRVTVGNKRVTMGNVPVTVAE